MNRVAHAVSVAILLCVALLALAFAPGADAGARSSRRRRDSPVIALAEAVTLAPQVSDTAAGRRALGVVAGRTTHTRAWFHGRPAG